MRKRPEHWIPLGQAAAAARGETDLAPGPGETLDCLSGHWKIFQLKRGHRYSTDDLLVAWLASRSLAEREIASAAHLDLGCGVCSVGLLVLWRFPRLRLVGIEAQDVSVGLARRSVRYNGIDDRADIRLGDFRSRDLLNPDERFDLITASPPYLAHGEGQRSGRPQRGPCRFEDRGGAGDYLEAAEAHLAPGGTVVWAHATRHLEANLRAASGLGLGAVLWRSVVFREGKESLITLFRANRGRPSGARQNPPLVVRRPDGSWSDEYRRIRREMGFPS
jgi:tRNA1Val (adenine37-N6)-methyltransferase